MQKCTDIARQIAAREIDARNEIARQDLATANALADLVTPRVSGRRRAYIETACVWRGVRIEIRGPEIDPTDLGVLLALLALAIRDVRDIAPGVSRGELIPADRRDENSVAPLDSLNVQTTVAEIARMIGRDPRDGRARAAIRAAVSRLASVVMTPIADEDWGVTHLIRGAVARGGAVTASLNYRATKVIVGGGQWTPIDMARWRSARGDVERLLLHRIAALTTGRLVTAHLDTLAAKCWTTEPRHAHERRDRRGLVRAAIESGRVLPADIRAVIGAAGLVTFTREGAVENTQGKTA